MKNLFKFLTISFSILSIHVFSQNLILQQNNGIQQYYLLTKQFKIVFSDSGCIMNIYSDTLQSYPIIELKQLTFQNADCYTGINELSTNKEQLTTKIYPNPFSNQTNIELTLDKYSTTLILIYNGQGILIKNLLNTQLNKGTYKYTWDGRSDAGNKLSAGMYFCQVNIADITFTSKIFLIY